MGELPKAWVGGAEWYVDRRLLQLRQVDDPLTFLDFSDEDALDDYLEGTREEG